MSTVTPGTLIRGYRVGRCLGRGAMGEVYEARREAIGRRVALKILRHGTDTALNAAKRLLEEARAVNVIHHPGIIQIFDVGLMDQRRPYLVMELLEGRSLASMMKRGPMQLTAATSILEQMLSALDAAHRAGVVHRDLKPSNVFLVGDGVKLLDFGVARREGREELLTAPATTVGSIGFMAPEQLRGQTSPASDLYALGCLAFLMFTGVPVFPARNAPENARLHLLSAPPKLRTVRSQLSPSLETWVARLLEKSPEDRFASAQVALDELRSHRLEPSLRRTEVVPAFVPPNPERTRPSSRFVPGTARAVPPRPPVPTVIVSGDPDP
ncbi:MAG: serine/threonine protein kinase [Archangium sp.]|nr:serine/threonine protein kinase [Archangium sp.]